MTLEALKSLKITVFNNETTVNWDLEGKKFSDRELTIFTTYPEIKHIYNTYLDKEYPKRSLKTHLGQLMLKLQKEETDRLISEAKKSVVVTTTASTIITANNSGSGANKKPGKIVLA